MSVNHQKRIEGVVQDALKGAAAGESYGFNVAFTFAPPLGQDGMPDVTQPYIPAWFLTVTIRNNMLGQPDIGNGFPVFGVLPSDDSFRAVATGLLSRCRMDRDKQQEGGLAAAQAAFKAQQEQAK